MNSGDQARLNGRALQHESDLGGGGFYRASLADSSSGASRHGRWPIAQWRNARVAIDGVGEVRDSGYRLAYRRAITNF
jgi:hypothetical protein